ncbi:Uncharacterised protein [Chryseobacterium indoltheticum]|uniref:Uncharacterized protein n=1 Tax=Chryseobacterium indoltheticum TaxID=254 RepID=A0A381FK23_9FLAO|nr:Uncharacterised protein [Chryseobacterium indoltheticum]
MNLKPVIVIKEQTFKDYCRIPLTLARIEAVNTQQSGKVEGLALAKKRVRSTSG